MTDKEAMKFALEALEKTEQVMKQYIDDGYVANRLGFVRNSITVLKDALAQPAPVVNHYVDGGHLVYPPAQRTWEGLTDAEIEKVWRGIRANEYHDCVQPFAKAIEAKLRSKNEHRG
jgi:hypothetical protein